MATDGYVVKPWNYQEGKTYAVAFLIHGGPQGSFGDGWSYRWNPQTYAGQGYAVVMVDFHGSTGYGQAFTDAISQHWGAAQGHRVEVSVLPRREPLVAEAAEQRALARHGECMVEAAHRTVREPAWGAVGGSRLRSWR